MENYKYLSEPRKPFFSVGKALIALLIILFNFWSFDVFAADVNAYIYDCNRDSDGFGVSIDLTSTPVIQFIGRSGSGSTNGKVISFKSKYKFISGYVNAACLLTDEPNEVVKPVVIETCNYGAKIEDMIPVVAGGWSSGFFKHSSVSYKYKIETASDIKYACDILHRYDVICHTDNDLAVPSFRVDLIKDYPKYNSTVQMGYQGCLYDALLTEDLDNKWDGECYNATFYRTDSPSDTIGSVDFNPYSCQEKTCPSGQSLDFQGICQNITIQCPDGQFPHDGLCLSKEPNKFYSIHSIWDKSFGGNLNTANTLLQNYYSGKQRVNLTASQALNFANGLARYVVTNKNYTSVRSSTSFYGDHNIYIKITGADGENVSSGALSYSTSKYCEVSKKYVALNVDCSTAEKQCPDGSTVNQGQNCATKICSDGSEIPFDYVCPVVDGGSGGDGSGGFDISKLLTKTDKLITNSDKSLQNQQYHIDESNNLKSHLSSSNNPVRGLETADGLSFYTPTYSSFDQVWQKHKESFNSSALHEYTQKWTKGVTGSLSLSSLYTMCFDMGSMGNYGCLQIPIDSRIWLFIRSLMIFSSVILARKLTLGG